MVEQLDQAAKPSGTVQVLKLETHEKKQIDGESPQSDLGKQSG